MTAGPYREEAFPQHLLDRWRDLFLQLHDASPDGAVEVATVWENRVRSFVPKIPEHASVIDRAVWSREQAHRSGNWPLIDSDCVTRVYRAEIHILPVLDEARILVVSDGILARLWLRRKVEGKYLRDVLVIIESVHGRDDHYVRMIHHGDLIVAHFFPGADVMFFDKGPVLE